MKFCLLFICLATSVFGTCLKERIDQAKPGDYVVLEAGRTLTIAAIRANTGSTLIFEEISAPLQNLKKMPKDWSEWIKEKAPGHTSWSMTEVDLKTGEILESYSFSRSSWVHLSQNESFFATLLHLPMRKAENLRKIGPPPMDGEIDRRKLWAPPFFFEKKQVEGAAFEAFAVTWPKDETDLSEKDAILYFDQAKRSPFPFWIQVETAHLTASVKTVDAGSNLASIYRSLPRRVPEFVGIPQHTKNGIKLAVKCPKYYRQFELFAVDISTQTRRLCPVEHKILETKEELVVIEIAKRELEENLTKNHQYTWLIAPTGHQELYSQSTKPFVFN